MKCFKDMTFLGLHLTVRSNLKGALIATRSGKRLFNTSSSMLKCDANAASHLLYLSTFDIIDNNTSFKRLSGIVCTIGPSSAAPETLLEMMEKGMGLARLNFSHGSHEYHANSIRNIRVAGEMYHKKHGFVKPTAIALDTKGPEIRTGLLKGGGPDVEVELNRGDEVVITVDARHADQGTASVIYVDYPNITKMMKPGNMLFLDDGLISLAVRKVESDRLVCEVKAGGKLGNTKGVNIPGVDVDLPAVTERDKADLRFGVERGVDIIMASFIKDAAGVQAIREALGSEGSKIKIVAKIEDHQGWLHLDEIIDAADGVMVARGDLGIEIPPEKVFLAQKATIAKCNMKGKPVICATQLLESMISKPRPTRAETSDVANAILDGADCLLLSGETAKGAYPVECVAVMADICREAEAAVWHRQLFIDLTANLPVPLAPVHTVAIAAVEAANKSNAAVIVALPMTGRSAQLIAKYRPPCPIITVTRDPRTARQCKLHRGIFSAIMEDEEADDWLVEVDNRIRCGVRLARAYSFVNAGDTVVVVSSSTRNPALVNTVRVLRASLYFG